MYCRTTDIHLVWEQKRGDLSPSGLRGTPVDKLYCIILLVGGLEHYLFFHDYSQLTFIFFRGVGIPPTRWYYIMIFNIVSPIRTQSLTPPWSWQDMQKSREEAEQKRVTMEEVGSWKLLLRLGIPPFDGGLEFRAGKIVGPNEDFPASHVIDFRRQMFIYHELT